MGAAAGSDAARLATESIARYVSTTLRCYNDIGNANDSLLFKSLKDAALQAHDAVRAEAASRPQQKRMATTLTMLVAVWPWAYVVQVGDSRAYLIRNEKIYQITKDQSLVQQLIDAQQISAEEAETHTLKNVILQALGAQNEIYPVSARLAPAQNDVLLVCSDGLSNKVSAASMQNHVSSNIDQLELACAELVKEANENGGEDNITVILAKLVGDSLPVSEGEEVQLELIDLGNIHDTADQEDVDTQEQDTAEIT